MDFFDNRSFRLNKILTCAVGQWPFQSKKQKIIISTFYFFINFSFIAFTVNGLITLNLGFDDILNNITIIMTGVGVGIKLINCIVKKKKLKSLLNRINSHWMSMSDPEVKILEKCSEEGKLIIVGYLVVVYSSMFLFLLTSYTPFILDIIKPLNESRPKKRVYRTNYFIDDEKYFYYLFMHEQLSVFLNMTTVICVDTMYVKYVEQACGLFSVLRYRLENIIEGSDSNSSKRNTSKNDAEITKEVLFCVAFHRNAIMFAKTIESIYGTALFLQISLAMILLSATAYVTAIKLGTLNEFIQLAPFAFGQVTHMFYNILPGQKLMDSSEEVGISVYSTEWYRMPIKAQKLLISLMVQSFQRPCSIQACGGIFILSMETFSASMRTSFSYFTVLLSMKD